MIHKKNMTLMSLAVIFLGALFLFIIRTNTNDGLYTDLAQKKESISKAFQEDAYIEDTGSAQTEQKTLLGKDEANSFSLNSNTLRPSQYEAFFAINTDYVGWIQIGETLVNYPIVKGRDNDFYLDHNFNKESDNQGSIYMDYRNFGSGFDQHSIIYGHNMKDESMFGSLRHYMDEGYLTQNPTITIDDLYNTRTYQIISVYYAKAQSDLLQLSFNDDYDDYISALLSRSMVFTDSTIDLEGNLLTLVTCGYEVDDGRYFIHAIEQ